MNEFGYILTAIATGCWAIDRRAVEPMIRSLTAAPATLSEDAKKHTPNQDERIRDKGSVAVISVHGPMFVRIDEIFERFFGVTSTERVGRDVTTAANDPNVSAILLLVDSPGGMIQGLTELSATIRAARDVKPVIAIADPLAASAAFWVAAQATELVVAPQGDVGSIGVFTIHNDLSQMLENEGINRTLISAGKFKAEGNPFEPLDDEAREFLQGRVDQGLADFIADVAKGRNVSPAKVASDFGQGRVLEARAALKAGMVDRIATFTETFSRFAAQPREGRERRARLARAKATAKQERMS